MGNNPLIPPGTEIRKAIEGLKKAPGTFQRLCEMYAQLRYPKRFNRVVPYGRREDDVTIKGWPDAYAPVEGGYEALEVTHSPDWTSHLKKDRERANTFGGKAIKGLLFIAWFDNPKIETIERYKENFGKPCVPENNLTFVFIEELVRDLSSRGHYARILSGILGLSNTPFPFIPVDKANFLYGTNETPGLSAPTLSEYHNRLVHRPNIADIVEERLHDRNWVIVIGKGASGKTSLALQIAHGNNYSFSIEEEKGKQARYSNAYYFNLAGEEGSIEVIDIPRVTLVISEYADGGVLFILDNIHYNEPAAADIFMHWENASRGSHLLMLGRETTKLPNIHGTNEYLDNKVFVDNTIILELEQKDIEGVYKRLAERSTDDGTEIEMPPDQKITEWYNLFGFSLVIFSAAVAKGIERWKQCKEKDKWTLFMQDALDKAYDVYIKPIEDKDTEIKYLYRIAVMSKRERGVPIEAMDGKKDPVPYARRSGLIRYIHSEKNNRYYLQIPHPERADLLLQAAGKKTEETALLIDIIRKSPRDTFSIERRLKGKGEIEPANRILRVVSEERRLLYAYLLFPNLAGKHVCISYFNDSGLSTYEQTSDILLDYEYDLIESALNTPLEDITHFLKFAPKNNMKGVYKCIVGNFERTDGKGVLIHNERLIERAFNTPLNYLARFLEFAEGEMNGLYRYIIRIFEKKDSKGLLINQTGIMNSFFRTPFGDIPGFIKFAKDRKLGVIKALDKALIEKNEDGELTYQNDIINKALNTPLDCLARFLEFAESEMNGLYRYIIRVFEKKDSKGLLINQTGIINSFFRTPFGDIPSFIKFAQDRKLDIIKALDKALIEKNEDGESTYRNDIINKALNTPLEHLTHFLEFAGEKRNA